MRVTAWRDHSQPREPLQVDAAVRVAHQAARDRVDGDAAGFEVGLARRDRAPARARDAMGFAAAARPAPLAGAVTTRRTADQRAGLFWQWRGLLLEAEDQGGGEGQPRRGAALVARPWRRGDGGCALVISRLPPCGLVHHPAQPVDAASRRTANEAVERFCACDKRCGEVGLVNRPGLWRQQSHRSRS
jgi:hypothetical protein